MHDYFETNKVELFNFWLDHDKNWDECKLYVDRIHESGNRSTRGFKSMKGRDIKAAYGDTKGQEIIEARKKIGWCYKDDDFPDDDDEP